MNREFNNKFNNEFNNEFDKINYDKEFNLIQLVDYLKNNFLGFLLFLLCFFIIFIVEHITKINSLIITMPNSLPNSINLPPQINNFIKKRHKSKKY